MEKIVFRIKKPLPKNQNNVLADVKEKLFLSYPSTDSILSHLNIFVAVIL